MHMKTQFSAACLLNCYWCGLSVVCTTDLCSEHCNPPSEGSAVYDPFTPEEWTIWSPYVYNVLQIMTSLLSHVPGCCKKTQSSDLPMLLE